MYRALFLGLVLGSGMLWAGAPMDLDSPFLKTVILLNRYNQIEEAEILQAEIEGENLKMRKPDGTLIVANKAKVLGILPRLPSPDLTYTQAQAQRAYQVLVSARQDFPGRIETSASVLSTWRSLTQEPSRHEKVLADTQEKGRRAWLEKLAPGTDQPAPVDMVAYLQEGKELLKSTGDNQRLVKERLEQVKQLMSIELDHVRRLELSPRWEEVGVLVPVGVACFILVVGLWMFANIGNCLVALRAGVIRIDRQGGRAIHLGGFLNLIYASLAGGLLFYVFSPPAPPKETSVKTLEESHLDKALYLSMNTGAKWSWQNPSSVQVAAPEWVNFIGGKIAHKEVRLNQFLAFSSPHLAFEKSRISWIQPIQLAILPLQLQFGLKVGEENLSIANLKVETFRLGGLPLGSYIGGHLLAALLPAYADWDQTLGLASGATWEWVGTETLKLQTPKVLPRSEKTSGQNLGQTQKPVFQEKISGIDLAKIFSAGFGEVYLNRYVELTGQIYEVSSSRRLGNNLAGEIVRQGITRSGGVDAVAKVDSMGSEDFPDIFYLATDSDGSAKKIKLKCLVKSSQTYFQDSRGDIYEGGKNPGMDEPLVRRGKLALFKGGRVEGFQNDTIEIYGSEPPTEAP